MTHELHTFVKESLQKGKERSDIQNALLQAGWQEEEVQKALASFAEISFPVPVPMPKPYLQAREAFLYLLSFIALYISAFSFGVLVFAFIDKFFPNPLDFYRSFAARGLTTALASMIIAFPLYLFMMRLLSRTAVQDPERRQSKIGKWLTYITLVVAAGIIMGDLIALLSSLLQGELTWRFVLKAATILTIAGSIFGYYLWSLQREEKEKPTANTSGMEVVREKPVIVKIFTGVVVAAVTGAVLYGLILVGTPAQQRLIQFDERRVSDLNQITFAIDSYWERNGKVPDSLEDLQDPRYFVNSIVDPKTGEPYEYRPTDEGIYELCAVFETDSTQGEGEFQRPFSAQSWSHGVGRTCFERQVQAPPGARIPELPELPVPAR